jgi:hypothetical protein
MSTNGAKSSTALPQATWRDVKRPLTLRKTPVIEQETLSTGQTPLSIEQRPFTTELTPLATGQSLLTATQQSFVTEQKALRTEPSWRTLLPSRSIFEKPRVHWPNPEESIGVGCSSLGRNKCWEVIGPAREMSCNILREIKNILDQHSEFLHENETIPFSIMFGIYMIGRSESNASPTLLICCSPKKPRQKALNIVREIGILQDYPGIRLAGASQSPVASDQVRPLGTLRAAYGNFVYFSPPTQNDICGRPILLLDEVEAGDGFIPFIAKKATIGGFVRLGNSEYDGLYCGLTVGHAFMEGLEPPQSSLDIDFAFDDDDEEGVLEDKPELQTKDGKTFNYLDSKS